MNNVKFGALFLASLMLFEPTLHAAQFVSYAKKHRIFDMQEGFISKHLSFVKTQFNGDWLDLLAYEEQLEKLELEKADELDLSEVFDDADFRQADLVNTVQLASPMPDGGPDQPEVQSFSPIDVSDMVDPFTGDFSYNIPLMDVDGYPLNIAYNAGVTMDQEASWVGLGWNLNPGVINRNLRGLPDEFDGSDVVEKEVSLKPNETVSVNFNADVELIGLNNLGLSAGQTITHNTYDGFSSSVSFGVQMPIANTNSSLGLSFNGSSSDGASVSPNVSINIPGFKGNSLGKLNVGSSFNSRNGLSQVNISYSNPTKKAKNTVVQRKKTRDGLRNVNARDGYRASASFDMGMTSFSPSIRYSMYSVGITFSMKVGPDFAGLDASGTMIGAFSKSTVRHNTITKKAYGYGYLHLGQKNLNGYLDYSRENDGPFTQNTPALPLPVLTYDVFSVQGQGISGSFRPVRSDIGYVFDSYSNTQSDNGSLGGELNLGTTTKGGVDINLSFSNGHSGAWVKGNQASNIIGFKNPNVFFREAGEFSIQDELFHFNAIGGFRPLRFLNSGYNQLGNVLVSHNDLDDSYINMPATNYNRSSNPRRNKVMTTLTIEDVRNGAGIKQFPYNAYAYVQAPSHHVGEFTVLNTEGTRYVYGLPAYSFKQIDASFAVNGTQNTYDCQHGLISYAAGVNNAIGNEAGMDGFFERETKPAFAHSYLLTTVLNSDYVDADNVPGPSKGDLGGYLILNYKKLSIPSTSTYKWRNPVQENKAFFDFGMNSVPDDQKAHYMYGEKELWYVEEIVSKNHIARFYMSNREDAVSVNGENGGMDTTNLKMQKLDSISLYTIPEYELLGDNAVPIKTVHFVYDYSLCPDYAYNITSGQGKLTLKSIYFTYENSKKGEYTAYNFTYSEVNPAYNNKHVDRWGNYKAPDGSYSCGNVTSGAYRPWDYPYVTSDKEIADENASAWNLTEISLPSGGKIEVFYESDDYGFVQHKAVNQMYDLVDAGGLFHVEFSPLNPNPYITIQMDPGTVPTDYCQVGEEIYFRALTRIFDGLENSEYVPGFAVVKSLAVEGTNQLKITLEPARIKIAGVSTDQHPFVLAGINFARMYVPKEIPPSSSNAIDDSSEPGEFIQAIAGAYSSFGELFLGVNGYLLVQHIANYVSVEKSHVRLKKPNGTRFGGGHRVKEVRIHDAWNEMSGISGQQFYYGQQYSYNLEGNQQSSGVAAYEPQLGGDENVWRQPVHYISREVMLAPDEANMQFEPFGEQFFPSPSVGYSRVTISNLERTGVQRTATGHVVHEFYTAKDYPTIVRYTTAAPKEGDIKFKFSIFGGTTAQRLSASQGFVVETNNMHGVPKAQSVYAQGHTSPITKIEYEYFDSYDATLGHRVLENNMVAIEKNGQVSNKIIGINYEAVADFRESLHESLSKSHDFNLNYTMPFILIPMLLGQTNKNYTELRTASFVKVIERFGIQKITRAHDLGSVVETANLAWDAETGEILVTRTKTNFQDDIYSFTYPAHWHYDLMGQAYRNVGKDFILSTSGQDLSGFGSEVIKLNVAISFNNGYTGQLNSQNFASGDELYVTTYDGESFKAWVTECNQSGIKVEDKYGNPISGLYRRVRILRSGRRNIQTTPVGSIVLRENPIPVLGGNIFDKVLQAGAVEYSDDWRTFCECFRDGDSTIYTTNPYVLGLRGTWRPKASYVHLAGRTQTYDDGNSNIRHDGMFTSFTPFYRLENGKWVIDRRDWTYTSSVVEFSPFGQALETIDALDRYSSSMYGYNQTLPIAVAANTRYRQLGFDGFEDYAFDNCSDNHFRVAQGSESGISTQESHTGRYSFKVTGESTYRFSSNLVAECDTLAPVFEPCPIVLVCHGTLQTVEIDSVSMGVMYFEISGGQGPYSYDFEVNNPNVSFDIQGEMIVIYALPSDFYNALLNTVVTVTDQTGCSQVFVIQNFICYPE
jgi:hypothetical protein